MKHKILFLILSGICFADSSLFAQHVTEDQALQKAQAFLQGRIEATVSSNRAPRKMYRLAKAAQNDAYYVFNAEDNGGFVIVSGDERTDEILGYSTVGNIDFDNIPDNMRAWLNSYEEQILSLPARVKAAPAKVPTHPAIEPLISTTWSQDAPYNLQCPKIDEQHCLTGCVATVLAQMMYYHKWPLESTTSIPAYGYGYQGWNEETQTPIYKYHENELPATQFDWSMMRNSYYSDEINASTDAVSELMRYCGQSVEMDYGLSGSSSSVNNVVYALPTYFGYDEGIRFLESRFFTIAGWDALIYNELQQSRPVIFSGSSEVAGHAYICDGYDGNQMYHLNWGWGGWYDGFFKFSIMNTDDNTQGAILTSPLSYSRTSMRAIVGIQKPTDTPAVDPLAGTTLSLEQINGTFSFLIHIGQYRSATIYTGLGIMDADDNISSVVPLYSVGIPGAMDKAYGYIYFGLSAGQLGLGDGKYRIIPMYKSPSDTEWRCGPEGCQPMYKDVIVSDGVFVQALSNPDISLVSMTEGDGFVDATFANTGSTDIVAILRYLFTDGELPELPDNTNTPAIWTEYTDLCIEAGATETVRLKFPYTEKGAYHYRLLLEPNYFYLTEKQTQGFVISEGTIYWGSYLLGDVNGNDGIDIGDAVTIVNYLVSKESETFIEKVADTNKNGKIDIGDAVTIVNYLVGKTASLSRKVDTEWNEREPQ